MKKEGIFHVLCMFLQKTKKVFDILRVYKHFGLPLAILSLLRQPQRELLNFASVGCVPWQKLFYIFNSVVIFHQPG